MYLTTLLIMLLVILFSKDEDVKLIMFISGCAFFSDYLIWLSDSQYFYQRHIVRDLLLAVICFWFKRKDFNWAGIVCLVYAALFTYEYLHTYQSPIYHYLSTIQIVLMQLYLLALTYKSKWKFPLDIFKKSW